MIKLAKAIQFDTACALHTKKEQFNGWMSNKSEELLAKFFAWAFSKAAVQKAIANEIKCSTPIGKLLNDHIENSFDGRGVGVEDVEGLGRAIDDAVESALENFEVDADNVSHLEQAITDGLENAKFTVDNIDGLESAIAEYIDNDEDVQRELTQAVLEQIVKKLNR